MKRNTIKIFSSLIAVTLVFVMGSSAVFAQNTETTLPRAAIQSKDRADKELVRRVEALNNLEARIQQMRSISSTGKSNLVSQLQNQINALTNLKGVIDAEASSTALKAELKSVTDSYRVFALIIPQGTIYSSLDRINIIVSYMSLIGAKLQTRINAITASGVVAPITLTTAMSDYAAKLNDAEAKVQAAFSEISNLVPDQGDQTVLQSNNAALKDARSKIKIAHEDIIASRKDINTVRESLLKEKSTTANASTTAQ